MNILSRFVAFVALIAPSSLPAAETILYGPAPSWVSRAVLPDPAKLPADASPLLLFDSQQRVERDTLRIYLDTASRALTAEALSQLAGLSIPWMPDKGDLTIHELMIQRGGERIDLLARGQKFTALRREENIDQRELTGLLTATLPVEGLQVGDVLRLSYSVSVQDKALDGRVQSLMPVLAAPVRAGFARMLLSWPKAQPPQWKLLVGNVDAKPIAKGDYTGIEIPLPAPRLPEIPSDTPVRFRPFPLLEVSTFSGWEDVSRVMAPLYAAEKPLPAPLAAEVAAIMKAEPGQVGRAARALRLVQDQVRYLAVMMNGGNYVPQAPARTWELRYGDCKAKSLLLLALLRAMGIEAEPVLASLQLGDWVPKRLPSAAAFDHVIVRATVDGRTMWLDGTRSGTRLADIWDVPPFRHGLPLRIAGAGLMPIDLRNDARPMIDLAVDADESASADLASVMTVSSTMRGELAAKFAQAGPISAEQRRQVASRLFAPFLGDLQLGDVSLSIDDNAGTATLKARAVAGSPWRTVDGRLQRDPLKLASDMTFAPDRSRPAWSAIPVAVEGPIAIRWTLRLRLPEGGRGYALEGEPSQAVNIAGSDLRRNIAITNGVMSVEERVDGTGQEVPVAQIAVQRDRLATLKAHLPRLVAPIDARRRWDINRADPAGSTQIKATEAVYAEAIAAEPDQTASYVARANFRRAIGDRPGALADFGKALSIAPTSDLYLSRAWTHHSLNDLPAALADAEAARALDPSDAGANGAVAGFRAERGDLSGALALLDDRIAVGGEARTEYRRAKADVLAQYGDAAEAMKILDALIAEKPGTPSLANARCWLMGTRSIALDAAPRQCTMAVELSENPAAALDSRAFVWFRLGRYDDALRDLDAALAQAPGLAAALYMRGIVLARLDRREEAVRSLAQARRISPRIDASYARYGVKP